MHTSSNPLVDLLQAVANEIERIAAALDDWMWDQFAETEQRTVGQLIDHVAWAWVAESAAFQRIADGATGSGWTQEWLDARNAEQAELSAGRTRAEILRRLHDALEQVVSFVENLDPTQLQRSGSHMPGEPERTVAGWIEVCLIGHPREHLPEIEAALERSR